MKHPPSAPTLVLSTLPLQGPVRPTALLAESLIETSAPAPAPTPVPTPPGGLLQKAIFTTALTMALPPSISAASIGDDRTWLTNPEATRLLIIQRAPEASLEMEAIRALVTDDHSSAPGVLLGALRRSDLPPSARTELLLLAEQVRIPDPHQRAEMATALLTIARSLRDANEATADPPLWSALRRFGSLATPDLAPALADFLRPNDSATTRQAALLAIQSILEFRQATEGAETERLRLRLHELASKYLDPDWLVSGPNSALGLAAFVAAVLAQVSSAPSLARQMTTLGRARLLGRSLQALAEAHAARLAHGAPISETLTQVLAILRASAARSTSTAEPATS